MQPRVLRSLTLLLFLNLLIKPLWFFGIDRGVQNLNGLSEYGLYYALWNFSLYLQVVLDPGLHTWNNRTVAQEPEQLSELLSTLLPLKMLLSVLYLAATITLGFFFGFRGDAIRLLFCIGLVQVLQSLLLYMRTNISGLQRFNTDSIFSVLDRSLMILICGAFLWTAWFGKQFSVAQFVYAQMAATGVALLFAGTLVFRAAGRFKPHLNVGEFYKLLRKSWPFALLGILMTLYTKADTTMLKLMLPDGARESGVYASAYRLLEVSNNFAFLFATILMPLLAHLFARKENVMPVANLFFRILMVPSVLLVLGCYCYSPFIMGMLYKEATPYSAQVFNFLMPSFLAFGTIYIYGSLLTARGNLRFLNISSAIGLACNILLNLWLIPRYGALGAAMSALFTQGGVALSQYLRAHLLYPSSVPSSDILRWAIFILVAVGSFLLFSHLLVSWKANLILLTGANLIFAAATGLLKPRYFIQLLKSNV